MYQSTSVSLIENRCTWAKLHPSKAAKADRLWATGAENSRPLYLEQLHYIGKHLADIFGQALDDAATVAMSLLGAPLKCARVEFEAEIALTSCVCCGSHKNTATFKRHRVYLYAHTTPTMRKDREATKGMRTKT